MSRVLVTGGAGYIGAHVCEVLSRAGYQVRIYDDFSNGLRRRTDGNFSDIVVGDLADRDLLVTALTGIDSVIHLAAKKSVEESVSNPLKYYVTNLGGTLNLLGAMAVRKVKTIVFSSTAAVYSITDKPAIEESDPTIPLSPYGATKLLSEELISKVSKAEGFSSVSLRYFNVVGAAKPEFGDNSKDNLVPKVFAAIRRGERPEIYGDDYPTPDGTCIRDYIHVSDLAQAHLSALKYAESAQVDEVFNVGSGTGYSVQEMLTQISESVGVDVNPRITSRRAGDGAKLISSVAKIERELGWHPRANLKEMIESSWQAEQVNR